MIKFIRNAFRRLTTGAIVFALSFFCFAWPVFAQDSGVADDSAPSLKVQIPGVSFSMAQKCGDNNFCSAWISQYIVGFYNYAVSIVGLLSVAVLMWAGFVWATAAGNPARISEAKAWMKSALTGLILVSVSYTILYQVSPDLLTFRPLSLARFDRGVSNEEMEKLYAERDRERIESMAAKRGQYISIIGKSEITHDWWSTARSSDGSTKLASLVDGLRGGFVLGESEKKVKAKVVKSDDALIVKPSSVSENSVVMVKFFLNDNVGDIASVKVRIINKDKNKTVKINNKTFFSLYNDGEHGDDAKGDKVWSVPVDTKANGLDSGNYQSEVIVEYTDKGKANMKITEDFGISQPLKDAIANVGANTYIGGQLIVKFLPSDFSLPFNLEPKTETEKRDYREGNNLAMVEVVSPNYSLVKMSQPLKSAFEKNKLLKIKRMFKPSAKEKEKIRSSKGEYEPEASIYNIYTLFFERDVDVKVVKSELEAIKGVERADYNRPASLNATVGSTPFIPDSAYYNKQNYQEKTGYTGESYSGTPLVCAPDRAYNKSRSCLNTCETSDSTWNYTGQWNLRRIGMEDAWGINKKCTSVAVLDKISNAGQPYYHGQHILGIIGNSFGEKTAGICGGSSSFVTVNGHKIASNCYPDNYSDTSGSVDISSLTYDDSNAVSVVNMSWGVRINDSSDIMYEVLHRPIEDNRKLGILMVASTGDNGSDDSINYPAGFDEVLAVGASNACNSGTCFSNYNQSFTNQPSFVEVVAPGTHILSNSVSDYDYSDVCGSKLSDNEVASLSGSSVATAQVSGVAALLGGYMDSKGASRDDLSNKADYADRLRAVIDYTTDDVDTDNIEAAIRGEKDDQSGYGQVNAGRAMTFLKNGVSGIKSVLFLCKDLGSGDYDCQNSARVVEAGGNYEITDVPAGKYKTATCFLNYRGGINVRDVLSKQNGDEGAIAKAYPSIDYLSCQTGNLEIKENEEQYDVVFSKDVSTEVEIGGISFSNEITRAEKVFFDNGCVTINKTGDGAKKLDILFIPDGFTDLALFRAKVDEARQALSTQAPYSSFFDSINFSYIGTSSGLISDCGQDDFYSGTKCNLNNIRTAASKCSFDVPIVIANRDFDSFSWNMKADSFGNKTIGASVLSARLDSGTFQKAVLRELSRSLVGLANEHYSGGVTGIKEVGYSADEIDLAPNCFSLAKCPTCVKNCGYSSDSGWYAKPEDNLMRNINSSTFGAWNSALITKAFDIYHNSGEDDGSYCSYEKNVASQLSCGSSINEKVVCTGDNGQSINAKIYVSDLVNGKEYASYFASSTSDGSYYSQSVPCVKEFCGHITRNICIDLNNDGSVYVSSNNTYCDPQDRSFVGSAEFDVIGCDTDTGMKDVYLAGRQNVTTGESMLFRNTWSQSCTVSDQVDDASGPDDYASYYVLNSNFSDSKSRKVVTSKYRNGTYLSTGPLVIPKNCHPNPSTTYEFTTTVGGVACRNHTCGDVNNCGSFKENVCIDSNGDDLVDIKNGDPSICEPGDASFVGFWSYNVTGCGIDNSKSRCIFKTNPASVYTNLPLDSFTAPLISCQNGSVTDLYVYGDLNCYEDAGLTVPVNNLNVIISSQRGDGTGWINTSLKTPVSNSLLDNVCASGHCTHTSGHVCVDYNNDGYNIEGGASPTVCEPGDSSYVGSFEYQGIECFPKKASDFSCVLNYNSNYFPLYNTDKTLAPVKEVKVGEAYYPISPSCVPNNFRYVESVKVGNKSWNTQFLDCKYTSCNSSLPATIWATTNKTDFCDSSVSGSVVSYQSNVCVDFDNTGDIAKVVAGGYDNNVCDSADPTYIDSYRFGVVGCRDNGKVCRYERRGATVYNNISGYNYSAAPKEDYHFSCDLSYPWAMENAICDWSYYDSLPNSSPVLKNHSLISSIAVQEKIDGVDQGLKIVSGGNGDADGKTPFYQLLSSVCGTSYCGEIERNVCVDTNGDNNFDLDASGNCSFASPSYIGGVKFKVDGCFSGTKAGDYDTCKYKVGGTELNRSSVLKASFSMYDANYLDNVNDCWGPIYHKVTVNGVYKGFYKWYTSPFISLQSQWNFGLGSYQGLVCVGFGGITLTESQCNESSPYYVGSYEIQVNG